MSAPSLVLAKSKGYTNIKLKLPANPPDNKDLKKYDAFCVLGSTPFKKVLFKASFVLKFIACVGKYLITLAQFPLQSDTHPYYLTHLEKQFKIPI